MVTTEQLCCEPAASPSLMKLENTRDNGRNYWIRKVLSMQRKKKKCGSVHSERLVSNQRPRRGWLYYGLLGWFVYSLALHCAWRPYIIHQFQAPIQRTKKDTYGLPVVKTQPHGELRVTGYGPGEGLGIPRPTIDTHKPRRPDRHEAISPRAPPQPGTGTAFLSFFLRFRILVCSRIKSVE
jgi:hypothetical protein